LVPGAHVTVIGITDRSFTQPYILLSAAMPEDPGYFGERLNAARQALTRTWKQRSAKLKPEFPATDIIGALELASQIFDQESVGSKRILILFSDMRNHTKELDLESPAGVSSAANRPMPAPDLKSASVYALGVDGAGSTLAGWRRIESFWQHYLQRCGASITEYSALRTAALR
jgi:hypothetical protein